MFAYGFFTSPYPLIILIGVAIECLVIYLLFRPHANAFFARDSTGQLIQNEMSKRQIASVLFYIAGGLALVCSTAVTLFATKDHGLLLAGLVAVPILVVVLMLLFIGRLFSPNSNGMKEIGIVLLSSAAAGVVFQAMLAATFMSADFQKSLTPGKPAPDPNFVSAVISVATIAAFGGLLVWFSNRRRRSDRGEAHR